MIQLSTLPAASPENPAKMLSAAAPDGVFATLLVGEMDGGDATGGKMLPEGGKDLPVGLPGDGEAAKAALALANAFGIAAKVHPGTLSKGSEAVTAAEELPEAGSEANPDDTAEAPVAPSTVNEAEPALLPVAVLLPASTAPVSVQDKEADGIDPEKRPAAAAPVQLRAAKQHGETLATDEAPLDPGAQANAAEERAGQPARQDGARRADPVRAQLARELKIDLPAAEKVAAASATGGEAAGAKAGQAPAITLPLAPAHFSDALNATQGGKPAFQAPGQDQGIRPQDFTLLVDRLVEARESARGGSASLSLMHADFGEVSLRFTHENGNLTVSMANADPEFARAVSAAAPADGAQTGEAPMQQGGRRDDGAAAFSTRSDASTGERDGVGHRRETQQESEQAELPGRMAGTGGQTALGGVFA